MASFFHAKRDSQNSPLVVASAIASFPVINITLSFFLFSWLMPMYMYNVMHRLCLIQLIPTSRSKNSKKEIKIQISVNWFQSIKQNGHGIIQCSDLWYLLFSISFTWGMPFCFCHFCYSHWDGTVVRVLASYKCRLRLDLIKIPSTIRELCGLSFFCWFLFLVQKWILLKWKPSLAQVCFKSLTTLSKQTMVNLTFGLQR